MGAAIVIVIICFLLIIFCIYMAISTSITKKKMKTERKNKIKDKKASAYANLAHVNGLPIANDVSCEIFACPDHYEFVANGNTFTVSRDKVTDVSVKTDVEIEKQYVSSIGGAVAGAVIAGPLGAMVGGRAKKKESRTYTHYLIFTYVSDEEIKYISFLAYGNLTQFITDFKQHNHNNNATITL